MSLAEAANRLDFMDGYIHRVMVDILHTDGPEAGLYNFYQGRIRDGYALSAYDRMISGFAHKHFDRERRRIVHAGIGIGTLASVLAVSGYQVAGIEQDGRRFAAATRLRNALIQAWPDVADRYNLICGPYPEATDGTALLNSDTVLVFTNCGATWTDEQMKRILQSFEVCGDVILDARLFGDTRDLPAQRQELLSRIEGHGLIVTPIGESPPGAFYNHIHPPR